MLKSPKHAGVVAGLVALCTSGSAVGQTAPLEFEVRYTAAAAGSTELAPMPTVAVMPKGSAAISSDLSAQLTDAVTAAGDGAADGDRFSATARPSGSAVRWSYNALTQPRSANRNLTEAYLNNLLSCLHSLAEDSVEIAALNLLLAGGAAPGEAERDAAKSGGRQMFENWKANRCQTRRNSLPFFERNKADIRAATSGMLTDEFDATVFNGQPLLDLIRSLYPLFYHPGGLWAVDRKARLDALFVTAVDGGFLTVDEARNVAQIEFSSYWDWVVYVTANKPTLSRAFFLAVAEHCVGSIGGLGEPFQLQQCVDGGDLELVPLRARGKDYVAAQAGGAQ
ncbi:hypothetical protein WMF11_15040 [Sorangium sp. So ce295]|uniref:hypothetical protein n=1 Tax=Sorangium sp. So ce295 TaxID=3133295 RepID=UPI003F601A3A